MNVILPGGGGGGGRRGGGLERREHPVAVLMIIRQSATANINLAITLFGVIIAEWML